MLGTDAIFTSDGVNLNFNPSPSVTAADQMFLSEAVENPELAW